MQLDNIRDYFNQKEFEVDTKNIEENVQVWLTEIDKDGKELNEIAISYDALQELMKLLGHHYPSYEKGE